MLSDFLKLSPRIWVLPVIHGSGDLAIEVRRVMLGQSFDCLAVPLPPSFQEQVEEAITWLPQLSLVVQEESRSFGGEHDSYQDNPMKIMIVRWMILPRSYRQKMLCQRAAMSRSIPANQ